MNIDYHKKYLKYKKKYILLKNLFGGNKICFDLAKYHFFNENIYTKLKNNKLKTNNIFDYIIIIEIIFRLIHELQFYNLDDIYYYINYLNNNLIFYNKLFYSKRDDAHQIWIENLIDNLIKKNYKIIITKDKNKLTIYLDNQNLIDLIKNYENKDEVDDESIKEYLYNIKIQIIESYNYFNNEFNKNECFYLIKNNLPYILNIQESINNLNELKKIYNQIKINFYDIVFNDKEIKINFDDIIFNDKEINYKNNFIDDLLLYICNIENSINKDLWISIITRYILKDDIYKKKNNLIKTKYTIIKNFYKKNNFIYDIYLYELGKKDASDNFYDIVFNNNNFEYKTNAKEYINGFNFILTDRNIWNKKMEEFIKNKQNIDLINSKFDSK
jgi:hypothetical protein